MAGLVFFVLMLLFMYILLSFALSISFDMSFLLFLFLFVIFKFFLNLLSFYHITVCPSLCYSFLSCHFSLSRWLYSSFFSYIISLFSMYLLFFFVSFLCPLLDILLSFFFVSFVFLFFVLASKRNNYTDSEINTIVFHLVPLITRDQQWHACSAYPVFSVARSANSASSCYAIAICSEPKFTKNVKSYRYRCVCKKKKKK